MMFVPGHNDRLLNSASRSIADSLILDVEDSVMPFKRKAEAREKIIRYTNEGIFKNFSLFPRINDKESGFLLKDLLALTIEGIDGFVYPKAFIAEDIYFIDKLLETIEYEKGFDIGDLRRVLTLGNSEAIAFAVQEGVGVGFVSMLVAEKIVKNKVSLVKIEDLELNQDIYIGRHRRLPSTSAQVAFWKMASDPNSETLKMVTSYLEN